MRTYLLITHRCSLLQVNESRAHRRSNRSSRSGGRRSRGNHGNNIDINNGSSGGVNAKNRKLSPATVYLSPKTPTLKVVLSLDNIIMKLPKVHFSHGVLPILQALAEHSNLFIVAMLPVPSASSPELTSSPSGAEKKDKSDRDLMKEDIVNLFRSSNLFSTPEEEEERTNKKKAETKQGLSLASVPPVTALRMSTIFQPHRIMFCSTATGKQAIVRHIEPSLFIDTDIAVLSALRPYIRDVVHIAPSFLTASSVSSSSSSRVPIPVFSSLFRYFIPPSALSSSRKKMKTTTKTPKTREKKAGSSANVIVHTK